MSGLRTLWDSISISQVTLGVLVGTGLTLLVDTYSSSKESGPPVTDLRLRVVDLRPTETGILLAVESSFTKRRFCPAYIVWTAESEDLFHVEGYEGIPFRFPLTAAYSAASDMGASTYVTVLWLILPPGDYQAAPTGHYDCDDRVYAVNEGGPVVPIRFSIVQRDGKLVCVLPN